LLLAIIISTNNSELNKRGLLYLSIMIYVAHCPNGDRMDAAWAPPPSVTEHIDGG
jgi:uncharacterized protein (UPF0212 family)